MVIAMRKLSPTWNDWLGSLGTGMLCSSLSVVTSEVDICIVRCLLQNESTQSVHVSFHFVVTKISPNFILERSVETFHYGVFYVVIFRGKESTLWSFRNDLNLRLTNSLPLSPCILFGVLFKVVNSYATASTNDLQICPS